ncbi:MAG: hypothetical protein ACLP5H_09975 [Desulfomonilaceae bacterium]
MSIDINDYIEFALVGIIEQIGEVYRQANTLWEAHGSDFDGAMNELEKLLRTVSDSVEIFQNYDGTYDRICRWCWGDHPGCYEVQCRLCTVQRLCSEETARREVEGKTAPEVEQENRRENGQEK